MASVYPSYTVYSGQIIMGSIVYGKFERQVLLQRLQAKGFLLLAAFIKDRVPLCSFQLYMPVAPRLIFSYHHQLISHQLINVPSTHFFLNLYFVFTAVNNISFPSMRLRKIKKETAKMFDSLICFLRLINPLFEKPKTYFGLSE